MSFGGSGRPRAAQKPFKKVGGKAPHLFKWFLSHPGPPNRFFIKSLTPHPLNHHRAAVEQAHFQNSHETALEFVSGTDFWCKLMSRVSPGDLGGAGVDLRPKTQENRPENCWPDCLQVPRRSVAPKWEREDVDTGRRPEVVPPRALSRQKLPASSAANRNPTRQGQIWVPKVLCHPRSRRPQVPRAGIRHDGATLGVLLRDPGSF